MTPKISVISLLTLTLLILDQVSAFSVSQKSSRSAFLSPLFRPQANLEWKRYMAEAGSTPEKDKEESDDDSKDSPASGSSSLPAQWENAKGLAAQQSASESGEKEDDNSSSDKPRKWKQMQDYVSSQEADDSEESDKPTDSVEQENEGGAWKTILLAGPLFLKFVVVLVIKFATDLIVFPLLWTYRFARLIKNKLLKLLGGGSPDSPNGANA